MRFSSGLFGASGVPLSLVAADFFLQAAIRRGLLASPNIAASQVAKVVAVRLGTAAVGLSVPFVGWILTVVAVGQTVYVVMNTPTDFQTWLKGCYVQKNNSDMPKRLSWAHEASDLEQLEDKPEAVGEEQNA